MPLDPQARVARCRTGGRDAAVPGTRCRGGTQVVDLNAVDLFGPLEEVARAEDVDLDGVPGRVYEPVQARAGALVWLHGGGWVIGSLESHDPLCRALAARSGSAVVAVDYRLPDIGIRPRSRTRGRRRRGRCASSVPLRWEVTAPVAISQPSSPWGSRPRRATATPGARRPRHQLRVRDLVVRRERHRVGLERATIDGSGVCMCGPRRRRDPEVSPLRAGRTCPGRLRPSS